MKEHSSAEMMNATKGILDRRVVIEIMETLAPYMISGRSRYMAVDNADLMNEYLRENFPDSLPGSLGTKLVDSGYILKGLGAPERARCLMEANGYTAVLPAEIPQKKNEGGIILFNPEGQAIITANQIFAEWQNKFCEETDLEEDNAKTDNATRGKQSDNWQEPTYFSENPVTSSPDRPEIFTRLENSDNPEIQRGMSFNPFLADIDALELSEDEETDFNNPQPLTVRQRFSYSDPAQVKVIEECNTKPGGGFCKYEDAKMTVAVPCFKTHHPDLKTFVNIVYWYKIYVSENPGQKQYQKCIEPALYDYKKQIADYAANQLFRTITETQIGVYLAQTSGKGVSEIIQSQQTALENLLGINSDFMHKQHVHDVLQHIVDKRQGTTWIRAGITAELSSPDNRMMIKQILGDLTSFNLLSALQLLELIGKGFLGPGFKKGFCQDDSQVTIIEANDPESVVLFLKNIYEESQLYYYLGQDSFYTAFDTANRHFLATHVELEKLALQQCRHNPLIRLDDIKQLRPQNGPAFIMDRYLGETVNIVSDIRWHMQNWLHDRSFDYHFMKDLISGNRVKIPLWEDGTFDSKKLKAEKRDTTFTCNPCFAPMAFRSNMQYIFVSGDAKQCFNILSTPEKKTAFWVLDDQEIAIPLVDNYQRSKVAFVILMLALYFTVDKYMLKKPWAISICEYASEGQSSAIEQSAKLAVQRFWDECCLDATDQAKEEWKKDPDLETYNTSGTISKRKDSKQDSSKKSQTKLGWQKCYGIDQLPTSSRRDIGFAFELWCAVNYIKVPEITSGQALMNELGQKLKVASVKDPTGKSCEGAFYQRTSQIKDKYYDDTISQSLENHTIKLTDINVSNAQDNQTRIYFGLSLKDDTVNQLLEEWKATLDGTNQSKKLRFFNGGLDFLMSEVVNDLSMTTSLPNTSHT